MQKENFKVIPFSIIETPEYHEKVIGDVVGLTQYLEKNNLDRVIKGTNGRHEYILVKDLIPLESQRNAKTAWIKKAIKLSGGFDAVAAGIIQVARDPQTGLNYVWDGAGRLALAQATGVTSLHCWVVDMNPQMAAHYFVYTQKTSNRNLNADELFINAYEKGESEAVAFADVLTRLGMRIQGAHDYWVPSVYVSERKQYPKCSERSIRYALSIAEGDESVVRFARDTIVDAGWNDDEIRKDLLPGLTMVYMVYPEMMKNGLSKSFKSYFQSLAGTVSQGKLQFKTMGGNMHNREVESVAKGIIIGFRASPSMKPGQNNVVTLLRINQYIGKRMNQQFNVDELGE
jgi:hypothetical protein